MFLFNNFSFARYRWLIPETLATWEVEIWRITVPG
jgi:hypothetical protein